VIFTPAAKLASAQQLLVLMTSAALGFSTVETMLYSTSGTLLQLPVPFGNVKRGLWFC
jgi:RsiW-degrading membrane proteinase PrsW (M82 family)